VLHATPRWLGVHAVSDGEGELCLPREVEVVYHLFEREVAPEHVARFSANLTKLSTQLCFVGERRLLALLPDRF
jgi:hypothetical protein